MQPSLVNVSPILESTDSSTSAAGISIVEMPLRPSLYLSCLTLDKRLWLVGQFWHNWWSFIFIICDSLLFHSCSEGGWAQTHSEGKRACCTTLLPWLPVGSERENTPSVKVLNWYSHSSPTRTPEFYQSHWDIQRRAHICTSKGPCNGFLQHYLQAPTIGAEDINEQEFIGSSPAWPRLGD